MQFLGPVNFNDTYYKPSPFSLSGGFETGDDGWTGGTRSTTSPRSGTWSYINSGVGSIEKIVSNDNMVELTVTFSIWMRRNFVASDGAIYYRYSGGSDILLDGPTALSSSGYTLFSGSFLVTDPGPITFSSTNSAIGGIFNDDWSITGVIL